MKGFPEGKLAPTDPPLTAKTCLLTSQLTVYTNGSTSSGTTDGCAGVIETCIDITHPTVLHRSHLRGAAFTSSFAEEAIVMNWNAPPPTTTTIRLQSAPVSKGRQGVTGSARQSWVVDGAPTDLQNSLNGDVIRTLLPINLLSLASSSFHLD